MDKNNEDFMTALTAAHRNFKEVIDEEFDDDHEYYRETPIFFSTLRKLIPINRH